MSIDNDTILPAVVAPTLASIREGNAYLAVSDTGIAVLTCRELLNGKGYTCNATSSTYDAALRDIVKEFQSDFGLTSDGYLGQGTLAVLEDTQSDTGWFVNGVANITAGKLARLGFKKLVLKPANVKKQNEICNSYGINSKTKIRHFLAQGMLETMYGTTFTETICRPGDSTQYESYAPYCGAGFLQLTHDYNYEAFREYMKTEKRSDDAKITTPATYATQYVADTYPFESAGWFWHIEKDLNTQSSNWASLSAEETVKKVTKEVRGSTSTYKERLEYYEKAKTIFK